MSHFHTFLYESYRKWRTKVLFLVLIVYLQSIYGFFFFRIMYLMFLLKITAICCNFNLDKIYALFGVNLFKTWNHGCVKFWTFRRSAQSIWCPQLFLYYYLLYCYCNMVWPNLFVSFCNLGMKLERAIISFFMSRWDDCCDIGMALIHWTCKMLTNVKKNLCI